jgi:hypothetical protein
VIIVAHYLVKTDVSVSRIIEANSQGEAQDMFKNSIKGVGKAIEALLPKAKVDAERYLTTDELPEEEFQKEVREDDVPF